MPNNTRDTLHTKLAEVYTHKGQYDDALESFHFAIRYSKCIASMYVIIIYLYTISTAMLYMPCGITLY